LRNYEAGDSAQFLHVTLNMEVTVHILMENRVLELSKNEI